ncbi:hypothetical protein MHYP_G00124080 [Metynnis hypsauchen]
MQTCLELPEAISNVGQLQSELKIASWPAAVNTFASLENYNTQKSSRGAGLETYEKRTVSAVSNRTEDSF